MKTLLIFNLVGYKTIAIEQCFDHSKKENVKRSSDIFPEPVNIKWVIEEFKNKLKILQRLTIIYMDVAVAHAMVRKKIVMFTMSVILTFLMVIYSFLY